MFALAGDYESLNRFDHESLQLTSSWSRSGGSKKEFTADGLVLIWRENKGLMLTAGEKSFNVMKELCKLV